MGASAPCRRDATVSADARPRGMAGQVLLLLSLLTPTFDAVLAPHEDGLSSLSTTTDSIPFDGHPTTGVPGDLTSPSTPSARAPGILPLDAHFSEGELPPPEAQALGAASPPAEERLHQDDVSGQGEEEDEYDEEYEDGDDEEYEDDPEDPDPDVYDDVDEDEYEDGDGDDDDQFRKDEEYDDEADYSEDEDEREGAGDGAVRERIAGGVAAEAEDADEEVGEDALARERRAEVRSLSDLPLSKLLRVQTELRRLTAPPSARRFDQCESKKHEAAASRRWLAGAATTEPTTPAVDRPNAQPLNWGVGSRKGPSSTTATPNRRAGDRGGDRGGGWSHEEWQEEEEEDGGWISWHKGGKKKGKGDIGSIFQISVTFLAFLAFGGYLLCLIMQAIKGGGYWNGYYPYAGAQGQVRPAPIMMVMMPTRGATRRPPRPAGATVAGRRRRNVGEDGKEEGQPEGPPPSGSTSWRSWVPSFGEEDIRLLPPMDVDRMHRALLVLAEGYASFYHKRYHTHHQ